MDGLLRDLRFALRGLLRTPGFTAAAVLALALGIGATTAIFSVVHAVLLRSFGWGEETRLVSVYRLFAGIGTGKGRLSIAELYDLREARFFEWVEQASSDFSGYGAERGVDRVLEKVARTLGEDPAKHAGRALGGGLSSARDAGVLGMGTGTGLLGPLVRRPVPRHTFHGDAPPTRRS